MTTLTTVKPRRGYIKDKDELSPEEAILRIMMLPRFG
jgi:hypothetical protein